jgi:sugar phosphate isomerase/epimerase
MKLSISNIAWSKSNDDTVYSLMSKYGCIGLDIAPSRVCTNPSLFKKNEEEIISFRRTLNSNGVHLVAMQSLLYGNQTVQLFESRDSNKIAIALLKNMIDLGFALGVSRLIFGSPKNRVIGHLTEEKMCVANETFTELGVYAKSKGIIFCIEPNPSVYGGDFLTSTIQAIEFVRKVDNANVKINLDTGTMIINDEKIREILHDNLDYVGHIHISMPNLSPISFLPLHHELISFLLRNNYQDWVSIEMAPVEEENQIAVIENALRQCRLAIDLAK